MAVSLNRDLPYDPLKDFAPMSMIGSSPYVLVIYPGLPAKNLAELIALAKAKPRALNYASVGPASLANLSVELFSQAAQVQPLLHEQAFGAAGRNQLFVEQDDLARSVCRSREGRRICLWS